jgi:ABC-type uncharacterized transport system permease subunit
MTVGILFSAPGGILFSMGAGIQFTISRSPGLEGFIYGIMTLGVFITLRVLDFPDLTADSSFPLGAVAIMAAMLVNGASPILALLVAF